MSKMTWNEVIMAMQVDGPTLTAAAAATMINADAKKTLPANYFDVVGQMLRIRASGRISSVVTTPGTARFDFRLGGTVVFDSLAILLDSVAAHTTVAWDLEILLTLRKIGSTANFWGVGKWTCEDILGVPATAPKGCLTAMLPWNTTPAIGANFDATGALQMDAFFTQTVATGSLTCHQFAVESMYL